MSFCCPPYVCIAVHTICASSFNSSHFLFCLSPFLLHDSKWLFASLWNLHCYLFLLPSSSHWMQFVCLYAIMSMRKLNSYNVLYWIYYSYNQRIHSQCFHCFSKWSKYDLPMTTIFFSYLVQYSVIIVSYLNINTVNVSPLIIVCFVLQYQIKIQLCCFWVLNECLFVPAFCF